MAKFVINADGIFKADGTKLRHHVNNIWQTLRVEADTITGRVLYKINGKKVGEYAFDSAAATVDTVTFGATSGTVYFDDAVVFLTHEYDDYCPTPKPVGDDGYDTLLNICNLWHDGTGWGAVSGYPDIEPALGYYDEGIPEVADWEIKFMVENGIDVQHMCWYSPSANIKEPIKKPQINYWALHEGFFNAKYSDLMKFAIMWENNSDVYGLDQFKEFVWPYWVEYYFTDSRYYTVDNQIFFTVWSYPNFRKAFGDTDEGAKAAIDFMNEDIKKYGFDRRKSRVLRLSPQGRRHLPDHGQYGRRRLLCLPLAAGRQQVRDHHRPFGKQRCKRRASHHSHRFGRLQQHRLVRYSQAAHLARRPQKSARIHQKRLSAAL